jgi:DNA-binding IclR family transcriptional regulator
MAVVVHYRNALGDGAMPRSAASPAYPIQSVDHALELLDLFAKRRRLTTGEIAKHLAVAPSTASRLVAMLQARDYIAREPDSRAYVVGAKLREIGLAAVRELDIRPQIHPYLESLSADTGETVQIGILQGQTVVFLDCVEGWHRLRVTSRVGELLPAHSLSTGKALLAELTAQDFLELYPREKLTAVTHRTMTSRGSLQRELAVVAKRGYATAFSESGDDISTVAVSIRDVVGRVRCGLSIAAPASRLTAKNADKFAALVRIAGGAIAASLF